ncbi:MAG: thiamine pyrophosphate-dependent enzyme, partial [Chthoniobacterales bacterium]
VRHYVESADLVLMLGTFITDMSMGFYTAKLERRHTILATTERVNVQYHHYDSLDFREFLEALANAKIPAKELRLRTNGRLPLPLKKTERNDALSMADVFRIVSLHIDEHCCVIADVGDAMFGGVAIRGAKQAQFIGPAYYMSMGFAVPASIGVAIARPELRPYVLVGDGAFQMTGVEISTAVRLGLNPIILVLNNDGYGTMRQLCDGSFTKITQWNYSRICELVGGGGSAVVSTKGEFDAALQKAKSATDVRVIEIKLSRDDVSLQLSTVAREVKRIRG